MAFLCDRTSRMRLSRVHESWEQWVKPFIWRRAIGIYRESKGWSAKSKAERVPSPDTGLG